VRKGDPVLVHGRLRTDVWEREDGHTSVSYVVEATCVGHDLSRGTAVFARAARPERLPAEDEGDPAVKEILHDTSFEGPQLDSFGRPRPDGGLGSGTQVA
jgi:single-strand DNA-binding protein